MISSWYGVCLRVGIVFLFLASPACSQEVEITRKDNIRVIQGPKRLKQHPEKQKKYSIKSNKCKQVAFLQAKEWNKNASLIYVQPGGSYIGATGPIKSTSWLYIFKNENSSECLYMMVNDDSIIDIGKKTTNCIQWVGVQDFEFGLQSAFDKYYKGKVFTSSKWFLLGIKINGRGEPFWFGQLTSLQYGSQDEIVLINANDLTKIDARRYLDDISNQYPW